jgi:hypothetical protein
MRIYKTGYRPSRLEKYIRVRFINCTDILLPSLFFSSYHVDHHHHIIIIFQPTPLKQFPELPSTMPPVSQFPPARVFFKNAAQHLDLETSVVGSIAAEPKIYNNRFFEQYIAGPTKSAAVNYTIFIYKEIETPH